MNRSFHRRGGFSLIEEVWSITLASMVLAVLCLSMAGILRLQQGVRDRGDGQREFARLAAQFRADVHRSERVESKAMPAGEAELASCDFSLLKQGSPSIRYQSTEDGRLTRTVASKDDASSREEYLLPPGSRVVLEAKDGATIALRIDIPLAGTPSSANAKRAWRIVAALDAEAQMIRQQGLRLP